MSTPLYSIEESLERSVISTLQGVTALSAISIVPADDSSEVEIPMISVRAENRGEISPGMQTYQMRLSVSLTASGDETTDDEKNTRRLPDSEDDDTGADGFKAEWKALDEAIKDSGFIAAINSSSMIHLWGREFEPASYETNDRTFTRTINVTLWANEITAT